MPDTIGGSVLLLEPTPDQYRDLKEGPEDDIPSLIRCGKELAGEAGIFVIIAPASCRPNRPKQPSFRRGKSTTYERKPLEHGFSQLLTQHQTMSIQSFDDDKLEVDSSITDDVEKFATVISDPTELGNVAYQTDIPAHTEEERRGAFLPPESPVWPFRGNKFPADGPVPGLHNPSAYQSRPWGPFAWHREDLRAWAVNYLYCGEKIWRVIEPGSEKQADRVFADMLGVTPTHNQYLRHQALHGGVDRLREGGVVVREFKQRAGQLVITLPGAYHSGFSVTSTQAEAVNWTDSTDRSEEYVPCNAECNDHDPITYEIAFSSDQPSDQPQNSTSLKKDAGKEQHAGEQHTGDEHTDEQNTGDDQQTKVAGPRRSGRRKSEGTPYPAGFVTGNNAQQAATLRSARQKAPRVAKDTSGKQRECGEQQGETVESPRLRRNKRAAAPNEPPSDEPQSKRKPRPVAIMAEHLRDANAIARLRGHIRALRGDGRLPEFEVKEKDTVRAAVAYCKIAIQAKQSAGYCGLRSWIAWASANKLINLEKEKANRKRNPEDVLKRAHAEVATLTYGAFKNRLSEAGKLENLGAFMAMLPFDGQLDDGIALRDYQRVGQDEMEQLKEQSARGIGSQLAEVADEFLTALREGKAYPRRAWEDVAETELVKSTLQHQVELLQRA